MNAIVNRFTRSRPVAVAAALAMLALVLATLPQTGRSQEKIRVSVPSKEITPFCMTSGMVHHPNFDQFARKYELEFEQILMQIPQVPVTVNGGDLDVGECSGIATLVNAWNKGAKNVVIFAVGAVLPVYQMVSAPTVGRLEDLKGKKIGIPGLQSAGAEAVDMIMRRGTNFVAGRDFDLVSAGANTARVAALVAGKIDAIPTVPPLSYELEDRGFPVLADEATYVPQYVSGAHIANRDWAKKNRATLVRLLKATIETGQWLKAPANREMAIAWFADNVASGGSEKLQPRFAAKMYDFYIGQKRLAFDGYAPESAVRSNLAILKERGYLKDADVPPLGELFDFSYLNEALAELGLPPVREYSSR